MTKAQREPTFWQTIRLCLRLIDNKQRRAGLWLVPLSVGVAIAEAAVAGLIFVLTTLLATGRASTGIGQRITEIFPGDPIVAVCVITFFGMFAKNILVTVETWTGARWVNDGSAQLAHRLFSAFLNAGPELSSRRHSAELVQAVSMLADSFFRSSLSSLRQLLSEIAIVVGVFIFLLSVTPVASLVAAATMGLLLVLLLQLAQNGARSLGVDINRVDAALALLVSESLQGARELRLAGLEQEILHEFYRERMALARLNRVRTTLETLPRVVAETLFIAGIGVMAIFAPRPTGAASGEAMALFAVFAYAGLRMMPSIHRIAYHYTRLRIDAAASERIERELVSAEELIAAQAQTAEVADLPLRSELTLHNVSVTYPGANKAALQNIDLQIKKGERIAIAGPTGAGKTTLLDVMVGLRKPSVGDVSIDTKALAGSERGWQRRIAYVPQVPFLLASSIAHNVTLERHPEARDANKLAHALAQAQLSDFVAALPAGANTLVGERGVCLSGGERQRIALARAFYREADVLIMDESTNALDADTESQVLEAAFADRKRTIVLVTHRPSAFSHCDRVVHLERGQMVEKLSSETGSKSAVRAVNVSGDSLS